MRRLVLVERDTEEIVAEGVEFWVGDVILCWSVDGMPVSVQHYRGLNDARRIVEDIGGRLLLALDNTHGGRTRPGGRLY